MDRFFQVKNKLFTKFQAIPIGRKLIFVFITATFISLTLASLFAVRYEESFLRPNVVQQLNVVSAILKQQLFAPLIFDNYEEAADSLSLLSTMPDVTGAALYNRLGEVFATHANAPVFQQLPVVEGVVFKNNEFHFASSMQYSGRTVGYLYITMKLPTLLERLPFHEMTIFLLLATLLILGVILTLLTKKMILKPISTLTETARHIAANRDYAMRLSAKNHDEMGVLSQSFNAMLDVIEEHAESLELSAQKLFYEKELAETTLASIQDGVIVTNSQGQITFLNTKAEKLMGWLGVMAEKKSINSVFQLFSHETDQPVLDFVTGAVESAKPAESPVNYRMINKEGQSLSIEASVSAIKNSVNEVVGTVIVFRDVSDKKEREKQLMQQAMHDRLTGLPNRFLFENHLRQILLAAKKLSVGKQVAILFLDLDSFKEVNDSLGHDIGDLLLIQVAKRLKHCVRARDLVCRQGGDEFVILLSQVENFSLVENIAQNILYSISQVFSIEQQAIKIGVSVGISLYPNDGRDMAQLIKKADIAMYHAKSQGRNSFQFYSETLGAAPIRKRILEKNAVISESPTVD